MTTLLNIAVTDGDGVRLLENRLSGEAHLRYAFTDHLGSTGGETDAYGYLTSREEYYSFGSSAGGDEEAGEITDRIRRYSGKERDATGLLYYGWRYYQPGAGRWLSADPGGLIDGANLFRFCRNNPTNLRDTDGRIPEPSEVERLAAWFGAQPQGTMNEQLLAGWQMALLPQAANNNNLASNPQNDVKEKNTVGIDPNATLYTSNNYSLLSPFPEPASVESEWFTSPQPSPFPEPASIESEWFSSPQPSPFPEPASVESVWFTSPQPSSPLPALKPSRTACERRYSCTVCENTFTRKSSLERHMLNHTGDKYYQCRHCDKAFAQLANLATHIRTHTGEKPYQCSICAISFAHSSHQREHMSVHTNERPHSCTLCEARFARQSTLTSHMRTHSGEKPYTCRTCNKAFSQSSNLHRHMRDHN